MNRLALLASCLVVLGACDKKDDAAKPAAAPGGDKPAAAPAKPAIGLESPKNNPKTVELAKKALACPFKAEGSFPFDTSCADYQAWLDDKKIYDEETLVSMLEDPDEKVRFLGAKKLSEDLNILDDKVLADRALTVAEKDKTPREQAELGYIVGRIKLEGTDLFPRIKALLNAKETSANMRVGLTASLLRKNPTNNDAFGLMREALKNPDFDPNVRSTAFGSFSWEEVKPEKCDVFLENLENPELAGDAVSLMSRPGLHCDAHYDAMLKSLEERVKAKNVKTANFGNAIRMFCDPKSTAKPPQLKKAVAIAKKIAEDKTLEGRVRASGIDGALACDPKGAKAYTGKFKKETDADIKESLARYERIQANAKKKK